MHDLTLQVVQLVVQVPIDSFNREVDLISIHNFGVILITNVDFYYLDEFHTYLGIKHLTVDFPTWDNPRG